MIIFEISLNNTPELNEVKSIMTVRKLHNFISLSVITTILSLIAGPFYNHFAPTMAFAEYRFGDPDNAIIVTPAGNVSQFDVDYAIIPGNYANIVVKNPDVKQQTANLKSGSHVTGGITPVTGQEPDGVFHLFLTKDKIKVSKTRIRFGKVYNLENIVDQCKERDLKCFVVEADIPTKEKKGIYTLVYQVQFNDAQVKPSLKINVDSS